MKRKAIRGIAVLAADGRPPRWRRKTAIRRHRRVPRDAGRRQPRRAVRGQGRRPVEEEARPEERLAGALRPGQGPGRGQGRLRRAAALLCRHGQGAGPGVAPADLHEHAAGHRPQGSRPQFGRASRPTWTALATWISPSRGHGLQPAARACRRAHACTKWASALFFFRGGADDFSCASCHGEEGKRIRLQDLPNLTKAPGDGIGFAAWPAYRVSNGQMWSMQHRLNDCYRQQRFPYPGYAPAT
jgi:hypothetical protein